MSVVILSHQARAGEFYQELSQHKCHGNTPLQLWPLLCLLLTPGMINCTLPSTASYSSLQDVLSRYLSCRAERGGKNLTHVSTTRETRLLMGGGRRVQTLEQSDDDHWYPPMCYHETVGLYIYPSSPYLSLSVGPILKVPIWLSRPDS